MKVLVTPEFNKDMEALRKDLQQEAVRIFSMVSAMKEDEFGNSGLITRLADSVEEIYTIRGRSVRIFCTVDEYKNVYFLKVSAITHSILERTSSTRGETTLFSANGSAQAYIAHEDGTIYSFDGKPLAYLDDGNNIYGFNGKHLGWFEDEIIWNHGGDRVGFTKKRLPSFPGFEPFKGFKQFKPFKGFKRLAPFKPLFRRYGSAKTELLGFLEEGRS